MVRELRDFSFAIFGNLVSIFSFELTRVFQGSLRQVKTLGRGVCSNGASITQARTNGLRAHLSDLHSGVTYCFGASNNSTVANGSDDQGRKRFKVNFVFCPGCTSTTV
jgi:hypothetical protein